MTLIPTKRVQMANRLPALSRRLLLGIFAAAQLSPNAHGQVPNDQTLPQIAVNQEAKDVETKLELLKQELFLAQQQITFLSSLHQFENHMQIRRVMFPSGKELIPAYTFAPLKIETAKRYPGLVIVHGAFHGRLDWRFFDLIDCAVTRGYVVIFPEYRGSSGYGDQLYKNNYGKIGR